MGGEDGFAGGITLDHENTANIFMSRQVNGVHELDRWTTSDGGTTWDSTAITRGSAKKNTRPCVPRNHKPYDKVDVVWMYGDYTSYGGGYNTAVKMYPVNETVAARLTSNSAIAGNDLFIRASSSGISFTNIRSSTASLRVYRLNGSLLADLSAAVHAMKAGPAFIPYSRIGCASGAYLFELKSVGKTFMQKLTVSRR